MKFEFAPLSKIHANAIRKHRTTTNQLKGLAKEEVGGSNSLVLPTFSITVKQILANELDTVNQTTVRVAPQSKTRTVSTELTIAEQPGVQTRLNDPIPADVLKALAVAEEAFASEEAFEPRLIELPSIYVILLWLHGKKSERSVFVPLHHAAGNLDENRLYSIEELRKLLQTEGKGGALREDPEEDSRSPNTRTE